MGYDAWPVEQQVRGVDGRGFWGRLRGVDGRGLVMAAGGGCLGIGDGCGGWMAGDFGDGCGGKAADRGQRMACQDSGETRGQGCGLADGWRGRVSLLLQEAADAAATAAAAAAATATAASGS